MNVNINNNNTIFNIGLAKLDIINNAMHMACRAQFNDQYHLSSLVLGLQCGILILIRVSEKDQINISVSYRINFQWSIDISNTFYGEYRYQYSQNLLKYR